MNPREGQPSTLETHNRSEGVTGPVHKRGKDQVVIHDASALH